MAAWQEADMPDLTGKRALVTGGASGIGYETARALAEKGAEVLLVDRNEQTSLAAIERIRQRRADARIAFRQLDLSSLAAIAAFADALLAEGRPLDVLVNNAGIQPINERRTSADGFELAFGIGHLGHFALGARLLPLIRQAPAARVVTVSSMVHAKGYFDWDDLQMANGYSAQRAYNQTKLANLLFARELQRRLDAAGVPIRSIAVHPGVARTAIGANRRQLGSYGLRDHFVSLVLSIVMPLLGQPAEAGALPTLFAASSPLAEPGGFYGPDGFGEMKGAPAPARIKPAGQSAQDTQKLWRVSETLTGTSFEL